MKEPRLFQLVELSGSGYLLTRKIAGPVNETTGEPTILEWQDALKNPFDVVDEMFKFLHEDLKRQVPPTAAEQDGTDVVVN